MAAISSPCGGRASAGAALGPPTPGKKKEGKTALQSHSAYEKMAEATASWPWARLPGTTWAVTEKVHGANLCLVCDGEHVKVAKRRGFIEPDDSFFGVRTAVKQLQKPARALFANLRALHMCVDARVCWMYVLAGEGAVWDRRSVLEACAGSDTGSSSAAAIRTRVLRR